MDLKIDSIIVQQPVCSDSTGSVEVFFSGGIPPYTVTLNDSIQDNINNNSVIFKNLNNKSSYLLMLIDSDQNIFVYPDNIGLFTEETSISVDVEPVTFYSETSPSVKLKIDGYPPYLIKWLKQDQTNYIAENQLELINILMPGDYSIFIKDNNGCEFIKDFTIDLPKQPTATYTTRADTSFNNYFPFVSVEKIRNTILIPQHKFPELQDLIPGNHIEIYHKNRKSIKFDQSVVFDAKTISISNQNYYMFYIANGIRISNLIALEKNNYILSYGNKEYTLSLELSKDKCSLLTGCLVLSNDYNFSFNKKDNIQIDVDGTRLQTTMTGLTNRQNYYLPMMNTTILFIENYDKATLDLLNKDSNKIYVRSLSTKKNQNKGHIILKINGLKGVTNSYKVYCEGLSNSFNQIYYTDGNLKIDNLDSGQYRIKIVDLDDHAIRMINNEYINSDHFIINILGSEDIEYKQIMNDLLKNKQVNPESLKNDTTSLPKLFRPVTPKFGFANLLINIRPYDSKVEIFGPDDYYYNADNSYQLLTNIVPGKYKVKINDQSTEFFIPQNTTHYFNEI